MLNMNMRPTKESVEKSEWIRIWDQEMKVKVISVEKVNNEYDVKRKFWNKSEGVLDMNMRPKKESESEKYWKNRRTGKVKV